MQFFKTTFGGILLTIVCVVAILFAREPRLLTAPNSWLINDTYDGFRTYAAMVYHVKHDSSYLHYEGMNYPYGDKAAFTDNLPLVTNALKFICRNITDVSDYCAGALNWTMLLSIVLCGVFMFLSFRTLKLPNWYAILVAVGVTMLSPQLLRLPAHYGLAHPFVIPLVFWLSALFHKDKKWSQSILIAVVLLLVAQLHFYLFAIAGGFILALLFFKTVFAFSRQALIVNGVHAFIQVVLPMLILQWMLSDDLVDRPSRPFGFFAYRAYWESIFLPIDFQMGDLIDNYITKVRVPDREGMAYIGLIPVLFLAKEVIAKIWQRIRKEEYHTFLPEDHRFYLKSAFWASGVILLFSFGFPFTIDAIADWRFYLGPAGQFRSLGRFAWVFFYVFNILAWYALYFQVRKIRKQGWQAMVFFMLLGVLFFESGAFVFQVVKLKLFETPDLRTDYQRSDNTWMETINFEEYQSIITIPFFHIGSENIWISPKSKGVHRPLWLGVQTGLPVNSSFMGRTSVGQVLNQIELIAETYRNPEILKDLPNDKDFLVYVYKKGLKQVGDRYEPFLRGLPIVFENEQIQILRLSIAEIKNRVKKNEQSVRAQFENATLFNYDGLLSTDSVRSHVYKSFDELPSEKTYFGNGAFEGVGDPAQILFDGHIPFQQTESSYIFSIWTFMKGDLYPKTIVRLEEYQAGTDNIVHRKDYQLYKDYRILDKGWLLSEFVFKMKRSDTRLRIKVWNKDLAGKSIYLDELQIRKVGTKLYRKMEDGSLVGDNRVYRKELK